MIPFQFAKVNIREYEKSEFFAGTKSFNGKLYRQGSCLVGRGEGRRKEDYSPPPPIDGKFILEKEEIFPIYLRNIVKY